MKKQLLSEEFKRMQQLAGIINENQLSEKDLINQYYNDLLNLGGGDLAGHHKDEMLDSIKSLGSFQEFLKQELKFANEEKGNEEWISIINKYLK